MTGLDHQFDHDARTERLLHRRQQPGGVIDLRWPQEMVARTAGWFGRRFPMLDHWNARYKSRAFEPVWAISEQRSSTAFPGSPLMPAPGDSMSTEVDSKPDSGPHQFRVRRQTASPQVTELSPSLEQKDTVRTSPGSGGIESPHQATTSNTVQRKTSTARDQDARTTSTVLASSLHHASHPPSGTPSLSRASEQPAGKTSELRSFPPARTIEVYPSREQWSAPMPLQLSSTTASGEFAGAGAKGPQAPTAAPFTPAGQSGEMTMHKHQELPGRVAGLVMQETGNDSQTIRKPVTIQRKVNPTSRVVHETPRQGPSLTTGPMIWRRAGTAQMISPAKPLLSGGPTAIQRLADSASVISSSSSALNSDSLATGPKTESGINIARMAEDVGRLLARQLVIERERRGRSL